MENLDVLRPKSRRSMPCPKCSGTGKVVISHKVRGTRADISEKVHCKNCNGHGFLRV